MRKLVLFSGAISFALLSLCSWSAPSRPAKVTVAISYEPQLGAQLTVADKQGFFKAQGLDVTLKPFPTGAAMKEAVVAGQLDVAVMGDPPALTIGAAGGPAHVVAQQANISGVQAIVASMAVKTPKDLEGKKVGYIKGSTPEALFTTFAKTYGVNASKVQLLTMGQPEMVAAMATGSVDAVVLTGPFVQQAAKAAKGGGWIMSTATTSYLPGREGPKKLIAVYGLVVMNDNFLKKDPDAAKRFLAAMAQATDFVNADRAKAVKIHAAASNIPEEEVERTMSLTTYQMFLNQELLDDLKNNARFLYSVDALKTDVNVSKLIDARYLKALRPTWVTIGK